MTHAKTQAVNAKMIKVTEDAIKFRSDPVYGPWILKQEEILSRDLETAFTKYNTKIQQKYNTDPKFKAMADEINETAMDLGEELEDQNGWTFSDNDGSLETAANQWDTVGLWTIGMTKTKTEAVNDKMQALVDDAEAFNADPVYGAWI